jgi:hypothetical protein
LPRISTARYAPNAQCLFDLRHVSKVHLFKSETRPCPKCGVVNFV